jgi:CubicO group peptidase (beta-lactamase class C family)
MLRRLALLPLALLLLGATPLPPQPGGVAWPTKRWPIGPPSADVDRQGLEQATNTLFEPIGRGGLPDTRALLVAQNGRIVWERYAGGFDVESPFRSWSMAKSVTNAMAGLLVRGGKLSLEGPAPVPRWQAVGDPRRALTLRHLLQMTSGLDNADGGDGTNSFVARILFGDLASDTAKGAEEVDLVHEPGTHWAYSTATSQIVSGIVARAIGGGREGVRTFLERELIDPLGARSLVVEFDAAGTPLGGGYTWANARDWARLGLLYMRDGVWQERRLLPEGWVDFSRSVAPTKNNGTYGAHFWVAGAPQEGQFQTLRPGIEAFQMSGNAGQFVVLVPDRDLVVVRLGEMHVATWGLLNDQIGALIEAFPREESP